MSAEAACKINTGTATGVTSLQLSLQLKGSSFHFSRSMLPGHLDGLIGTRQSLLSSLIWEAALGLRRFDVLVSRIDLPESRWELRIDMFACYSPCPLTQAFTSPLLLLVMRGV